MSYFRGKFYVYDCGDGIVMHGPQGHCCGDGDGHHAIVFPEAALGALALAVVAEMDERGRRKAMRYAEKHGRGNIGFDALFPSKDKKR